MLRLITILMAIGAVAYAVCWFRQLRRSEDIENMSPDELIDAIIRREISILEVPLKHRETVDDMIMEIRKEMDKTRIE